MRSRGLTVALVICLALLAAAPAALAQNATQNGYCESGCSTEHQVHHKSLPFTGLDIALVVAAGGALVAAGFGVRRLGRSETA